jgi:hypothetical protein
MCIVSAAIPMEETWVRRACLSEDIGRSAPAICLAFSRLRHVAIQLLRWHCVRTTRAVCSPKTCGLVQTDLFQAPPVAFSSPRTVATSAQLYTFVPAMYLGKMNCGPGDWDLTARLRSRPQPTWSNVQGQYLQMMRVQTAAWD